MIKPKLNAPNDRERVAYLEEYLASKDVQNATKVNIDNPHNLITDLFAGGWLENVCWFSLKNQNSSCDEIAALSGLYVVLYAVSNCFFLLFVFDE